MAALQTSAAQAAAAGPCTRPLFLVEIQWSTVLRLSTGGDVTWSGYAWSGALPLTVSGITAAGTVGQGGQLRIGNHSGAAGALALQGLDDVPVRIWHAHADALADADPMLVFEGVADGVTVGTASVDITLSALPSARSHSPSLIIGPAAGFNVLLPPGARVVAGQQTYIISR